MKRSKSRSVFSLGGATPNSSPIAARHSASFPALFTDANRDIPSSLQRNTSSVISTSGGQALRPVRPSPRHPLKSHGGNSFDR